MCVPAGIGAALSVVPGVANAVTTYLTKKSDADLQKYVKGVDGDVQVNVEQLRTSVALAQAGAAIRKADQESKWTAWMLPTLFGVTLAHYANVVLDRVTWLGHVPGSWGSVALPPEYADAEMKIMLSVAGISAATHVIKKVFSK
jgi:hypothetical protein